jgi:hypothetical protein
MKHLLFVFTLAVMLSACTPKQESRSAPTPSPVAVTEPSPVAVEGKMANPMAKPGGMTKEYLLSEQNKSGQTGKMMLTETVDDKTKVTLMMIGGTFTMPQPAHIHVGMCPSPGAVKYPLTNVVNGQSETVIDIKMNELANSTEKMAVNVHKSADEVKVYTACGNMK